jgi:hypothetical protein
MQVIGIASHGTLDKSPFTPRIFDTIHSARSGAILTEDDQDVSLLQTRLGCQFSRFLLVNEEGLGKLKTLDSAITSLGQVNSAEMVVKSNILSPRMD